ncbi:putative protein [Blastochloris viridis]|uniref:Methyltransferase FkbM domain-containing protein n=1 Tax=Blastochloris viridis TaxID=1079 RepID=A0A182D467_BLAVI|nr:putative protein [Blastochloris viridis]
MTQRPFEATVDCTIGACNFRMVARNKKTFNRAKKTALREPDTVNWLNSIPDGAVLWDIGANVGVFTLYAAVARGAEVIAFEPSAANYYLLNRNIELNALDGRVRALCLAVARHPGIDTLNMITTDFGGALSAFGTTTDSFGAEFQPAFRQGMVSFSLDDLAKSQLPFPSHIKIDVDGIEKDIVEGGPAFFRDPRLRSAIIELDPARPDLVDAVGEMMRSYGFCSKASYGAVARRVANVVFDRP